MAQLLCGTHLGAACIRATRLNPDCTYATGPNNSVTTTALISINTSADITEGTEIEQNNANGELCVSVKRPDNLKRVNIDLEMCSFDIDLLNVLTCQPEFLNGVGDTIGSYRQTGNNNCPGAFLEVWANVTTSTNTGFCTPSGAAANFARYVFPRVQLTLGDGTLSEDFNSVSLTGFSEPNPNALDGPFSDLEIAGNIPGNTPEAWFYEATIPDTAVKGCGYSTDVPADANTA